ncbi:MAG TPA: NfeD family protein [Ilumatobacteraceae bacterium]|mgnify:CR=1 FL=1|nr:NfeD family protein [Ilumatobacteraceae bacterium]HRB02557.1 NfeD family protein [Ilumatobacteraceae bacterium]
MVIAWIVICVALLAVELHHLAFFAIFGAAGAGAAALVAVADPGLIAGQVAVAAVVGAIGVVAVRPHMSKAIAHSGSPNAIAGVHGGLVGSNGVTTDEVGPRAGGHVRLLGETWLATSAYGDTLPAATPVAIVSVAGTTLTVRAAEEWELT